MDIGQKIENRRKFLQIKQEDLAEFCGISTKSIQKIENGQANPTMKTLETLLEVLGMELRIEIKRMNNES